MSLSDKRKELNSTVWHKKTFPIDILREVAKQDKEFIRRLKGKYKKKYAYDCEEIWDDIDKLAGDELI